MKTGLRTGLLALDQFGADVEPVTGHVTLRGGQQQRLCIARGLAVDPEVLLLDEPSMGLSPILVETIFDIVQHINRLGTTILLVEQNARMALAVSDQVVVLGKGAVVFAGATADAGSHGEVEDVSDAAPGSPAGLSTTPPRSPRRGPPAARPPAARPLLRRRAVDGRGGEPPP